MAYINQPPDLRILFSDLDNRLRKLETAVRFTAPNVNFFTSTPTNPREGDIFWDNYNDLMKYWDGTAWQVFEDSGIDPTVYSYTPVWGAVTTPPTYSPGAITGKYIKLGKWVFFTVAANLTSVTNFGTGQYTLTIPFAPDQNYVFRDGGLHEGANHYAIMLDVGTVNGTTGKMYYNSTTGKDEAFDNNSPHNLITADFWYISGSYLTP